MRQSFNKPLIAWIFILPQLVITLIFFLWPAFMALFQSLFQGDAFGISSHYSGFDNFVDLFDDISYLSSIKATLIFSVLVTLLTMSLGLFIAVLVNKVIKFKGLYKSILILPYAVAPAVAGILWRFLFNPAIGWMSHFASKMNIHLNYMVNPKQAMMVVVIAACWQQFSYNFLFFYAGLQSIPESLHEAAKLDGANSWQRFWHITFPLLTPTTFFLLVINLIYAFFDTFGIIQVMTQGGPGNSTTTLVYKVYNDGFLGLDLGSSAAQSVILMAVVILLTMVQFKYLEKKVHY
jgi:sn-glycerol 3-phosphate transport system permease protein